MGRSYLMRFMMMTVLVAGTASESFAGEGKPGFFARLFNTKSNQIFPTQTIGKVARRVGIHTLSDMDSLARNASVTTRAAALRRLDEKSGRLLDASSNFLSLARDLNASVRGIAAQDRPNLQKVGQTVFKNNALVQDPRVVSIAQHAPTYWSRFKNWIGDVFGSCFGKSCAAANNTHSRSAR